jgi:hypothetical protein
MADAAGFDLKQDREGMLWDLLLYVPTVLALATMALVFWYGDNASLAYLLSFMASFFFIAGANRILKRLLLLPSAPVRIEVAPGVIRLVRRNGRSTELVKEQRFFPEVSGKSFGISGMDRVGQRQQFELHRGQFADAAQYGSVQAALKRTAGKSK